MTRALSPSRLPIDRPMVDESAARNFILANARILEQRLYAVLFENADPGIVVDCLSSFRNVDGGFGHGLEPDKRTPDSQPLDVEVAFESLTTAAASAPSVVVAACDWLETVADERGALPILLPGTSSYPRASHWSAPEYEPSLNPTAGIASHVHALGVRHPWADKATEYCLSTLGAGEVPNEAHTLLGLTKLLATIPDRDRANELAPTIRSALSSASFMNMGVETQSYGLTPLEFAPSPTSFARPWFTDEAISAHLVRLGAAQTPDGGWQIAWEPLSEATRCEWRSIRTLWALRVFSAYL